MVKPSQLTMVNVKTGGRTPPTLFNILIDKWLIPLYKQKKIVIYCTNLKSLPDRLKRIIFLMLSYNFNATDLN